MHLTIVLASMCQCTHLLLHCRLSFTFTHFACSLHLCLILALCLSLFLVKWLRPVVEFSFAVHLARLRVPKQTHIFCFFFFKKKNPCILFHVCYAFFYYYFTSFSISVLASASTIPHTIVAHLHSTSELSIVLFSYFLCSDLRSP